MTEEEFKKTMTKVFSFIVIAMIILVIIGIVVFNQSGKTTSIFGSKSEIDSYNKKVKDINPHSITEEEIKELENSSEFQENETQDGSESEEEQVVENSEE